MRPVREDYLENLGHPGEDTRPSGQDWQWYKSVNILQKLKKESVIGESTPRLVGDALVYFEPG